MGVKQNLDPTLARPIKQFQLVGRAAPTQKTPVPKIYRMKVFAASKVLAKSKFWYFMKKLCKAKKTGGEMLAINEIFENNPNAVKNYGIWLRYRSRTDQPNMYKEYRDLTINGAVSQMYAEMSGRHRAHAESITIMKTAIIPASKVRRDHVKQMLNSKLKFPVVRKPPDHLRQVSVGAVRACYERVFRSLGDNRSH